MDHRSNRNLNGLHFLNGPHFEGPFAVVIIDTSGQIIAWNEGAELLYGWSAVEVIGRKVCDVLVRSGHEDRAGEIMDGIYRNPAASWKGRWSALRKDGSCVEVLVRDTPVLIDGKVVAVMGESVLAVSSVDAAAQPASLAAAGRCRSDLESYEPWARHVPSAPTSSNSMTRSPTASCSWHAWLV